MSEKSEPFIDILKIGLQKVLRQSQNDRSMEALPLFPEESQAAGSVLIEPGPLMRALILIEGEAEEYEPGGNEEKPTNRLRAIVPGSGIGLEYFGDDAFYPLKAVAKTDVRFYAVDWDALQQANSKPGILNRRLGLILRAAGIDLQKQRMTVIKLLTDHAIAEDALIQESASRVNLQTELETRVEVLETRVEKQESQIQEVKSQSAEMELRMQILTGTLSKLVGQVPDLLLLTPLMPIFENMMASREATLSRAGESMMEALCVMSGAKARPS